MFASQDDEQKSWVPYIIGMAATAVLSALGSKLVEWGVDELRERYGSKKPEKKEEASNADDKEKLREGR